MDAFDDVLTSTGDAKSLLEMNQNSDDSPPIFMKKPGGREALSKHPVPEMNHFQEYQNDSPEERRGKERGIKKQGKGKETVSDDKKNDTRLEAVASWVEESEAGHSRRSSRRESVITYHDVESGTQFTEPIDIDDIDLYGDEFGTYESDEAIDILSEVDTRNLRGAYRMHTPKTSRRLKEEEERLQREIDQYSLDEDGFQSDQEQGIQAKVVQKEPESKVAKKVERKDAPKGKEIVEKVKIEGKKKSTKSEVVPKKAVGKKEAVTGKKNQQQSVSDADEVEVIESNPDVAKMMTLCRV